MDKAWIVHGNASFYQTVQIYTYVKDCFTLIRVHNDARLLSTCVIGYWGICHAGPNPDSDLSERDEEKHLTLHKVVSQELPECHSLLLRRRAGDEALSSFAGLRVTPVTTSLF